MVRTVPFHGTNTSSNLVRDVDMRKGIHPKQYKINYILSNKSSNTVILRYNIKKFKVIKPTVTKQK